MEAKKDQYKKLIQSIEALNKTIEDLSKNVKKLNDKIEDQNKKDNKIIKIKKNGKEYTFKNKHIKFIEKKNLGGRVKTRVHFANRPPIDTNEELEFK